MSPHQYTPLLLVEYVDKGILWCTIPGPCHGTPIHPYMKILMKHRANVSMLSMPLCQVSHWASLAIRACLHDYYDLGIASFLHWTKNEISYMSCFPKLSISYAFLVEDRD